MVSERLTIASEMAAFDKKDKTFYQSLTEEEKKKFSTYLMLKFGGNVEGIPELQAWYLCATNERVNKNFFLLGRHPQLQWLLCTTVSPNMGVKKHYWLASKKDSDNKTEKFLRQEFPELNDQEISLMAKINTKQQIKEYAKSLGFDDKYIKKAL